MQSPTIGVKTLDNHRSRSFELPRFRGAIRSQGLYPPLTPPLWELCTGTAHRRSQGLDLPVVAAFYTDVPARTHGSEIREGREFIPVRTARRLIHMTRATV